MIILIEKKYGIQNDFTKYLKKSPEYNFSFKYFPNFAIACNISNNSTPVLLSASAQVAMATIS